MDTKDGRERAERISGPMRVALVNDLALGTKTHRQLAAKYHRSVDAIHQFSSRNAEEINAAKREMSEPIEYWGAQKVDQIAILSAQIVELGERYKADGLTPTQEKGFRGQLAKLVHQMSELTGELRTQIDVSGHVELPPVGTTWVQVAEVADGQHADS